MIELNKIYCENNLETMKRMPDNFVDLTVTSPPYDNLRTYKGFVFPFEEIAKELFRVTKDGGVVVWVVGDATINGSETGTSFRQALHFMETGFRLHDTMIYRTSKPPQNSGRYEPEFEYMFVLSKDKPKTFNPIYRERKWVDNRQSKGFHRNKEGIIAKKEFNQTEECVIGNVWDIISVGGVSAKDPIAYKHPAIYPEQLAKDHIYSWSNEGDLVYDPFMGSGTTAKMAHLLKRNWIGSEISQEYVDLANKRLDPYLRQERLAI